jgi:sulfur relay (sulfurtransferase) DsrF/TusC family protein
MTPRLLFIITSDPRVDGRAAEALRVSAGVGADRARKPAVYLRGPAVLALSEASEDLVDEEVYRQYLPLLAERARPVYVQRGAVPWAARSLTRVQFEELDDVQLARLAAASDYVLCF